MRNRVIGVCFFSFVVFAIGSASAESIWNMNADFSIDNGNPNGVWSYGYFVDSAFYLDTAVTPVPGGDWMYWGDGDTNIWKNLSESVSYGVQPGQVSLHPGYSGQVSVIRWMTPETVSGEVTIEGEFFVGDGGVMEVAVVKNENWSSLLWSATDCGVFALNPSVSAGDTIDFAVYGGYGWGNTPLEVTISAVPEPSTFALVIMGICSLAAIVRQRRG